MFNFICDLVFFLFNFFSCILYPRYRCNVSTVNFLSMLVMLPLILTPYYLPSLQFSLFFIFGHISQTPVSMQNFGKDCSWISVVHEIPIERQLNATQAEFSFHNVKFFDFIEFYFYQLFLNWVSSLFLLNLVTAHLVPRMSHLDT